MDIDCIFCQIVAGERKGKVVYQDDEIVAFRDINPQAPVHVLLVPRKHIVSVNDLTEEDSRLIGRMFLVAREVAASEGINERGYRLVINTNREAGQSVYHLHLHLLGGRRMSWPPG
jgi:histidine triad (HIT) family protein